MRVILSICCAVMFSFPLKAGDLQVNDSSVLRGIMREAKGAEVAAVESRQIKQGARYDKEKAVITHVAVPTRQGVQVFPADQVDVTDMSEPWLLVWYGGGLRHHWLPYKGDLFKVWSEIREAYWWKEPADQPVLAVCQRRPTDVSIDEGMLELAFAEESRVFEVPLFGNRIVPAAVTAAWESGLPGDIVSLCRIWTSLALNRPIAVTETFEIEGDDVVLQQTYSYEWLEADWPDETRRLKVAPVSPILSLLTDWTEMPLKVAGSVRDMEHVADFGPLKVARGDTLSVRIPDIMKYIRAKPAVRVPPSADVVGLRERMMSEIQQMINAGELAPVRSFAGEDRPVHFFFATPLEYFGPLANAYAAADAEGRTLIEDLARNMYAAHPFAQQKWQAWPFGEGVRREWEPHAEDFMDEKTKGETERVSLFHRAVALERYLSIVDDEEALQKGVENILTYLSKTPLDWDSWSQPSLEMWQAGWPAQAAIMDRQLIRTAGFISASRLARKAGETEMADTLAVQAVKTMISHAAMPALLGAYSVGIGSEEWHPGRNNVSQDYTVAFYTQEEGPHTSRKHWGDTTYQFLCGLTPEIARYWRDHSEQLASRDVMDDLYAWATDWYVTDGEPNFHLDEASRQMAEVAWTMFRGQAFFYRPGPDTLARWVDAPFCRVGDMFYIDKLALTILAHGGQHRD